MTEAGANSLGVDERAVAGHKHRPSVDQNEQRLAEMLYTVDESPAWYLCILLGLQHCMTCFGANLTVALVIAPAMCITDNNVISQILGTIFFMAGLVTILQSTLGMRLPLVQGATFAFVVPTFAILNLPQWQCPTASADAGNETDASTLQSASHTETFANMTSSASPLTSSDSSSIWQPRMREIQGAIILASVFEVILGFSGLIGVLVRYIGPLAIAPTITLVGLSLFPTAAQFAAKNWYIAVLTSFLILLFSQYMRRLNVPCFTLEGRGGAGGSERPSRVCVRGRSFPVFTLFPVILAIVLAWLLCAILTVTGAVPDDPSGWSYNARTDVKIGVLHEAAWFRFPYPFQWGMPTFSVGAVLGMLAGVSAGAIESIGDYYACARLCGAPPPPIHAVNRGIFVEGIGCILAGMWGSGSGSTTYSENVGAIGITKVGSRRVIQATGLFMILFGVFGKFGALLVTIPDPVIGGVFLIMFGIIAAVGVSNLQFVDLNSTRNLCIFGFSVFFGLTLPSWITSGDNVNSIRTGSSVLDQILAVLLSTSMFVGGFIGFLLDNTIPGSEKERGLSEWRKHLHTHGAGIVLPPGTPTTTGPNPPGGLSTPPPPTEPQSATVAIVLDLTSHRLSPRCYDLPFGMALAQRSAWLKYVPISPTFLQDVTGKPAVAVTTGGDDVISCNRSDTGIGGEDGGSSNGSPIGVQFQRRASAIMYI